MDMATAVMNKKYKETDRMKKMKIQASEMHEQGSEMRQYSSDNMDSYYDHGSTMGKTMPKGSMINKGEGAYENQSFKSALKKRNKNKEY